MRPIIVTSINTVENGKFTTEMAAGNLDEQSSILNRGLCFSYKLQRPVHVKIDETNEHATTWVIDDESINVEDIEGTEIFIQFTSLFALGGYKSIPIIVSEVATLTSNVVELTHKPWPMFHGCPILNFGYVLLKQEDGSVSYLSTSPAGESSPENAIIVNIPDEELERIKGSEIVIQYIYEHIEESITEYPIIYSEDVVVNDGKLTLSYKVNNLQDGTDILNFGLVTSEELEEYGIIQFNVIRESETVYTLPELDVNLLHALEGKKVSIQYVGLVTEEAIYDKSDIEMDGDFNSADNDIETGQPVHFSELGLDMDMIRRAKEEALAAKSNLTSNDGAFDDIVDGDFTEVTE